MSSNGGGIASTPRYGWKLFDPFPAVQYLHIFDELGPLVARALQGGLWTKVYTGVTWAELRFLPSAIFIQAYAGKHRSVHRGASGVQSPCRCQVGVTGYDFPITC